MAKQAKITPKEVTLQEKLKMQGYRQPETLSEVSVSEEVIILDLISHKINKQGKNSDLKSEWKSDEAYYKRLRELMDLELVFIKNK
jgi:hypothetical protein